MSNEPKNIKVTCGCFPLIGAVFASVLSYQLNHSVWWAILHFVCNWFYVAYKLAVKLAEYLI